MLTQQLSYFLITYHCSNAFKVTQSLIKTNQVSGKPRPPVFSRDQREIVKSAKVEVMMMICGLVENNISHLWSYEDEDGFGFKYFCSLYVLITFKRQQLPFLGSEHYLEHGQSFPRDPVQTLLQEISGTAPAPFQLLTIMLERIENTIKAFNSCLIFTDQGHALEVFKVGTLHLTFIIFLSGNKMLAL